MRKAGKEAEEVVSTGCAKICVFRLELEMKGFVPKNAGGDGLEELVLSEFEDGRVVRNGKAFGAG